MNIRKTKLENLSLIMLFCLASLSGCLLRVTETPAETFTRTVQPEPQASPTPTVTMSFSPTFTPTMTGMPTQQSTPEPTPSPAPNAAFKEFLVEEQCLPILQTTPPGLSGMILMSAGETAPSYLLDLQTRERVFWEAPIPEFISPNGRNLAYTDTDLNAIVVVDIKDGKTQTIPVSMEYWSLEGWLDDQHLQLLFLDKGLVSDRPFYIGLLVVLNPFTGEQQEWRPEYPGFDDFPYSVHWIIDSRQLINPSFTYVIYPAFEDDLPVILWDLVSQREIARVHNGDRESDPKWAPDGMSFVISAPPKITSGETIYKNSDDGLPFVGGQELFLVTTAGDVKRLTYFTTAGLEAWQSFYTWSPDGNKIAFLLKRGSYHAAVWQLAIMDIQTSKATVYCVSGGRPEWAGDERYVFITQTENSHSKVFLIDTQSAQWWQIAEDVSAVGWVVSPK